MTITRLNYVFCLEYCLIVAENSKYKEIDIINYVHVVSKVSSFVVDPVGARPIYNESFYCRSLHSAEKGAYSERSGTVGANLFLGWNNAIFPPGGGYLAPSTNSSILQTQSIHKLHEFSDAVRQMVETWGKICL